MKTMRSPGVRDPAKTSLPPCQSMAAIATPTSRSTLCSSTAASLFTRTPSLRSLLLAPLKIVADALLQAERLDQPHGAQGLRRARRHGPLALALLFAHRLDVEPRIAVDPDGVEVRSITASLPSKAS